MLQSSLVLPRVEPAYSPKMGLGDRLRTAKFQDPGADKEQTDQNQQVSNLVFAEQTLQGLSIILSLVAGIPFLSTCLDAPSYGETPPHRDKRIKLHTLLDIPS